MQVTKDFNKEGGELGFAHGIMITRVDNIAYYPQEMKLTVSHRVGLLGADLVAILAKLRKTVFTPG